jgi:hypothetical protein
MLLLPAAPGACSELGGGRPPSSRLRAGRDAASMSYAPPPSMHRSRPRFGRPQLAGRERTFSRSGLISSWSMLCLLRNHCGNRKGIATSESCRRLRYRLLGVTDLQSPADFTFGGALHLVADARRRCGFTRLLRGDVIRGLGDCLDRRFYSRRCLRSREQRRGHRRWRQPNCEDVRRAGEQPHIERFKSAKATRLRD